MSVHFTPLFAILSLQNRTLRCCLSAVKVEKSLYGLRLNKTKGKSLFLSCFAQYFLKSGRYAAYEVHTEVRTFVGDHIAMEETAEFAHKESVNLTVVLNTGDERNQRSQKAVCLRLTINAVYDLGLCQLVVPQEAAAQGLMIGVLEDITHEETSQHSTTAFVAQDPTQGRHILDYVLAVVKT